MHNPAGSEIRRFISSIWIHRHYASFANRFRILCHPVPPDLSALHSQGSVSKSPESRAKAAPLWKRDSGSPSKLLVDDKRDKSARVRGVAR